LCDIAKPQLRPDPIPLHTCFPYLLSIPALVCVTIFKIEKKSYRVLSAHCIPVHQTGLIYHIFFTNSNPLFSAPPCRAKWLYVKYRRYSKTMSQ
jgi:hypothetical protein